MSAIILDGNATALQIKHQITASIQERLKSGKRPPGLAVILVGQDTASQIYVRNKRQTCEQVGIISFAYDLPSTTTENELLGLLADLNINPEVDGIIVQMPLPQHINPQTIIEAIVPHKDVDGFHPYNIGRLATRNPLLRPCTPFGIITLLKHYKLPITGRDAVMIGASNIVGRPMALELLLEGATVTICHRFSEDIKSHIYRADILIVAIGKRGVINSEWINPGSVAIDVGMHRLADGKLYGDLDFVTAKERAGWITPVPGGVGPMTVITLLQNTLFAAGASMNSR